MKTLIEERENKNCSCVIRTSTGEIFTFHRRGVADLYEILSERPWMLRGAEIADKVVGKAAAAIMIQGGVVHLHTCVASQSALDLLKHSDVVVEAEVIVPHIINRKQTDWCPLEKRCLSLNSVEECIKAIGLFLKEQKLI